MHAQDDTEVWAATLVTPAASSTAATLFGWSHAFSTGYGTLDDTEFEYDSDGDGTDETYGLYALENDNASGGTLELCIRHAERGRLDSDTDALDALTLHIGAETFAIADVEWGTTTASGCGGFAWANSGLTWAVDDNIAVKLTEGTTPATAPVIENTSKQSSPDLGDFVIGDEIKVGLDFDQIVTVTGTPEIELEIGTETKTATHDEVIENMAAATSTVVFVYTVVEGDESTDGVVVRENSLTLPSGATIQNSEGLNAELAHDEQSFVNDFNVDGITPDFETAVIDPATDGTTLVLTYSEDLFEKDAPAGTDFMVEVAGALNAVTGVVVDNETVELTLTTAVTTTSGKVTLDYTPGANPIQDLAGNPAAALDDEEVTVVGALATDATLSALSVSPGPLKPAFAAGTTSYAVSVANSVDRVTVAATATDADKRHGRVPRRERRDDRRRRHGRRRPPGGPRRGREHDQGQGHGRGRESRPRPTRSS